MCVPASTLIRLEASCSPLTKTSCDLWAIVKFFRTTISSCYFHGLAITSWRHFKLFLVSSNPCLKLWNLQSYKNTSGFTRVLPWRNKGKTAAYSKIQLAMRFKMEGAWLTIYTANIRRKLEVWTRKPGDKNQPRRPYLSRRLDVTKSWP